MPAVMLKQRCFNPNHPKTAVSNREHIRYIATRSGVIKSEGLNHGLFGKAFGMEQYGNIENIKEFQQKIKEISDKKTVIYRCIVSLDENDAVRKGFDKRPAWEQAVNTQLSTIAKTMNIPIDKLEWCGAVHMDKGHPHIHLLYWEREQGIKKAWIDPKQSNHIRKAFTKSIFADELSLLYSHKDIAEKNIDALIKTALSNLYGDDVGEEEQKLLQEMRASDLDINPHKLRYNRVPLTGASEILCTLDALKESLPKTGRLSFAFMPPFVKEQITNIISKILDSNVEIKREFYSYVTTAMTRAELYSSNEEFVRKIGKDAHTKLENKLGNLILKQLKDISVTERENQRNGAIRRQQFETLITDIFSLLTGMNRQQSARGSSHRTDLSKQARKELAVKLENSDNINYDMEL